MEHFTVDGNRLTLLTEGPARFDALIALIDAARESLRILYYIYADDDSGRRVNQALIAAAARGVKVTLIVDGFGSDVDRRRLFFAPLEAAGVAVCRFMPRFGRSYLLRNHQKMALADGTRILIGGFNVEDDYFGTGAEAWRDLGLLVEGPAAGRITGYFDALYGWASGRTRPVRRLGRELARWSEEEGQVRWLIGGATRRMSPWVRAVRHDIRLGDRIDIVAGYFTPSPRMLRRLDRVGLRGAKVRIVTAAHSDNRATVAAARFTYRGLLKRGARIFEYLPSKLHTKLYAIDRVVHIGSANFDMRSLLINLELMLRIDDAAFAAHVHRYVDGEIAQSAEMTPERYRAETGWWQRIKHFVAYLVVGVLDPTVSRGLNLAIDEEE